MSSKEKQNIEERNFYAETFALNFQMLRWSGYWRAKFQADMATKLMLSYSRKFLIWCFFVLLISQLIAAYQVSMRESFSEGNYAIGTAACTAILWGKAVLIQRHMHFLEHLQNVLNTGLYMYPSIDKWVILTATAKKSRKILYRVIMLFIATVILWTTYPLFDYEKPYQFPLPFWVPFDTKGRPVYLLFYMHNVSMIVISVTWFIGFDLMLFMFLVQIAAQYDLLICRIRLNRQCRLVVYMIDCIRHHQKILSIIENINRVYRLPVLIQYAGGSVIICLCVFEIFVLGSSSFTILSMFKFLFLACSLVDLVFYSHYGQLIIDKNNELFNEIYELPWYRLNKSTCTLIKMMLIRGQKPPYLAIAGFAPVHLPSCLKMLSFVYNVFSMLRQISTVM